MIKKEIKQILFLSMGIIFVLVFNGCTKQPTKIDPKQKVYLVNTPACQIYYDKNQNDILYREGLCNLSGKEPEKTLETISDLYQYKQNNKIDNYINIAQKKHSIRLPNIDKELVAYEIEDSFLYGGVMTGVLLQVPNYQITKFKKEKYQIYKYISKFDIHKYDINTTKDLIVLGAFDQGLYKKQLKNINNVAKKHKIKIIHKPINFETSVYLATKSKALDGMDALYKTHRFMKSINYSHSYKNIISKYAYKIEKIKKLVQKEDFFKYYSKEDTQKILDLLKLDLKLKEYEPKYIKGTSTTSFDFLVKKIIDGVKKTPIKNYKKLSDKEKLLELLQNANENKDIVSAFAKVSKEITNLMFAMYFSNLEIKGRFELLMLAKDVFDLEYLELNNMIMPYESYNRGVKTMNGLIRQLQFTLDNFEQYSTLFDMPLEIFIKNKKSFNLYSCYDFGCRGKEKRLKNLLEKLEKKIYKNRK